MGAESILFFSVLTPRSSSFLANVTLGQIPAHLLIRPPKDRPVIVVIVKQTLVLALLPVDPINGLHVGVIEFQELMFQR